MITAERLKKILAGFPHLTIGLVGDLFLDRYLEIPDEVREMSIETGLEAYQISRVRNQPGALGTVLNNLAALGVGALIPVTLIGDDGHGFDLLRALRNLPVDPAFVIRDPDRLTPTYTKPLRISRDGSCTELNRLDVRVRAPVSEAATQRICEAMTEVWQRVDGLIVLDQINELNWGVVNDTVRAHLEALSRQQPDKLMLIDSRAHLERFRCGSPKGNETEFTRAVQQDGGASNAAESSASMLANRNQATAYCTVGAKGILVARPGQPVEMVPGFPAPGPVDIVGAGDSATSGIVASLLAGASETEAATIGNLVASITVQVVGSTGTATPDQVLRALPQ
jgi:bifunctional ADP-heptose synthase (sugar kinase/adenylyltransferase)